MPKNVRKNLGVHPKFTGFNVSHLNDVARANAKHAHNLTDGPGHKHTVEKLKKLDKGVKEDYPVLNVSLLGKYNSMRKLAKGTGGKK